MNLLYLHSFCVCAVILILISPISNSPRWKTRNQEFSTKLDQKQVGDYNIQVRLKDIQIIALLGGASGLGDYDYNYDYSDLTIKPTLSNSTTSSPESSPASELAPSQAPSNTATTQIINDSTSESSIINKPLEIASSSSSNGNNETPKPAVAQNISDDGLTKKTPSENSTPRPMKITGIVNPDNNQASVTNISIIPSIETANGALGKAQSSLGEILPRKCVDGFVRDKHGRCRKILRRASQLPLGFVRFASSIAARMKSGVSKKASTTDAS